MTDKSIYMYQLPKQSEKHPDKYVFTQKNREKGKWGLVVNSDDLQLQNLKSPGTDILTCI